MNAAEIEAIEDRARQVAATGDPAAAQRLAHRDVPALIAALGQAIRWREREIANADDADRRAADLATRLTDALAVLAWIEHPGGDMRTLADAQRAAREATARLTGLTGRTAQ